MTDKPIYMWDCCRCGDRMERSTDAKKVELDRNAHIQNCPRHRGPRAPWELRISTTATFVSAYVN